MTDGVNRCRAMCLINLYGLYQKYYPFTQIDSVVLLVYAIEIK
jgi:hypothetical protein